MKLNKPPLFSSVNEGAVLNSYLVNECIIDESKNLRSLGYTVANEHAYYSRFETSEELFGVDDFQMN